MTFSDDFIITIIRFLEIYTVDGRCVRCFSQDTDYFLQVHFDAVFTPRRQPDILAIFPFRISIMAIKSMPVPLSKMFSSP